MTLRILVIQGGRNDELPSGEQVVIAREVDALRSDGYFVHLDYGVGLPSGGISRLLFTIAGVIWSQANYRHVTSLIETHKPDIIHFHSIVPYLSLSVIYTAHRKGVPIVQTLHNGRWLCLEGGYYRGGHYCDDCVGTSGWKGVLRGCGHGRVASLVLFLVNLFARSCGRISQWVNRFIAVSSFIRKQHLDSGFPQEKVVVKNNGIDIDAVTRGKYQKSWAEREGVAFAGRISEAKGTKVLRHLIKHIKEPVHVIGSGPGLDDLKSFCNQEGFGHVIFWGYQTHEKTLGILGSVVCTVVPSQCGESFSLVAAESMALGTPVVASDLGGLSQLIKDSRGGYVVPPDAWDDFVDIVSLLLSSPDKARSVGQLGMQYVDEHLASDKNNEQLVALYQDIATGALNK